MRKPLFMPVPSTIAMMMLGTITGGSAVAQDNLAKQKAVAQIRRVADAIKQCAEQLTSAEQGQCGTHSKFDGPPANVEWDVLPSTTVRSPFQGVIEFALPSRSDYSDLPGLSNKAQQKCAGWRGSDALAAIYAHDHHYHHRYEFDVGSDDPELVKMLLVEDETKKTSAATDKAEMCWVQATRAIKSENATVSVIRSPIASSPTHSPDMTHPKRLQEVRAGMTFQAVMAGLRPEYKLTKVTDLIWGAERSDDARDAGEVWFNKDKVATHVGQFLPAGTGDAASFAEALFNAFYAHTPPATDEPSKQSLSVRRDMVQIEIQPNPTGDGAGQRIYFALSDGSVYSVFVFKDKSNKADVLLEQVWH